MTPTPQDHEAAARKLVADCFPTATGVFVKANDGSMWALEGHALTILGQRIAAALAEAVRMAVEKERERLLPYGTHLGGCAWMQDDSCTCGWRARSEAQATPAPAVCGWKKRSYLPPCGKPEAWHQPLSLGSHPFTRGTPPETKERG